MTATRSTSVGTALAPSTISVAILRSPCRFREARGYSASPPLFVAVEGTARIVRDKRAFAEHWSSDLERWFPEGIDTDGLVMIQVHADRIHYWDSNDEGEIST